MRTAAERLLLRLEWRVIRRLDGQLQGGYRTAHRGSGLDFVGLRGYVHGDDARHIDWNVTARLNEPYVRVFTEDPRTHPCRSCSTRSATWWWTPGRRKHDTLADLAVVLARLFGRGGNRVGVTTRAPAAVPPCGDLCFVWEGSADSLKDLLHHAAVKVELGPVPREGGRRKTGSSVYVRDPDGNLLEFMIYP